MTYIKLLSQVNFVSLFFPLWVGPRVSLEELRGDNKNNHLISASSDVCFFSRPIQWWTIIDGILFGKYLHHRLTIIWDFTSFHRFLFLRRFPSSAWSELHHYWFGAVKMWRQERLRISFCRQNKSAVSAERDVDLFVWRANCLALPLFHAFISWLKKSFQFKSLHIIFSFFFSHHCADHHSTNSTNTSERSTKENRFALINFFRVKSHFFWCWRKMGSNVHRWATIESITKWKFQFLCFEQVFCRFFISRFVTNTNLILSFTSLEFRSSPPDPRSFQLEPQSSRLEFLQW